MQKKILVVDDAKEIADLIDLYLENKHYLVFKTYNASDAIKYLNS